MRGVFVCQKESAMSQRPVLVVDDEPAIVAFVAEALEHEGYKVVTATDGMSGLGMLLLENPEAVVLDLDMPVVDGVSFVKSAATHGVSLPIILMTGASEVPQWARLLGATAYLQKPFEISELLAAVESVIGQP